MQMDDGGKPEKTKGFSVISRLDRGGRGMQNGPPGGGPFAGGCVPGDYCLDFFAGAAGAVAAGSWVLGWIASITGVAMKTEA